MREAVIKCKVAPFPFRYKSGQTALQAVLFITIGSRKLAAESAFCCEFNLCHYAFSAQTKWAKVKMNGNNSLKESFVGHMSGSLAPRNSFAHIMPIGLSLSRHLPESCCKEKC